MGGLDIPVMREGRYVQPNNGRMPPVEYQNKCLQLMMAVGRIPNEDPPRMGIKGYYQRWLDARDAIEWDAGDLAPPSIGYWEWILDEMQKLHA